MKATSLKWMMGLMITLLITACEKDEPQVQPVIPPAFTISKVQNDNPEAISVTVTIADFGSVLVKESGVVWSNSPAPTIDSEKYINVGGATSFTKVIAHSKTNTDFFFRAYVIQTDNTIIYSQEATLKTLTPMMTGFSPRSAAPGMDVTITGENFSASSKIFLENINIIPSALSATSITFRVPLGIQTDSASIAIELGTDKKTFYKKLHYKKGQWVQVASMPDNAPTMQYKMSLTAGGKGYVKPVFSATLWEYSPASNSWSSITNAPTTSSYFNWFSLDRQIYTQFANTNDTHSMYNLDTQLWSDLTSLPIPTFDPFFGVGFSVNSAGYMGLGNTKEIWRFKTLSWTKMSDFPGVGISRPMALATDNAVFIIGGYDGISAYTNENWRYDPVNDTWQKKSPYPGKGRVSFSGFVLNNKLYVGCGATKTSASNALVADDQDMSLDFWEYDPATDKWSAVADFPEARFNMYYFSNGTKGFAGAGTRTTAHTLLVKDLWEFRLQ